MQPFPSIHSSLIIESKQEVHLPETTHIDPGCIIMLGPNASLQIGERVTIYPGVVIRTTEGLIEIGDDVSIGPQTCIYEVRAGLRIGSATMLAAGVRICGVSHCWERIDVPMRRQTIKSLPVTIGNDVWIGMNTVIHPGIAIGDHTIIGSSSVVTKSIDSCSVAYGAPCRMIKRRSNNGLKSYEF